MQARVCGGGGRKERREGERGREGGERGRERREGRRERGGGKGGTENWAPLSRVFHNNNELGDET